MLLEPTSIAIIGASDEPTKIGHYILSNILTQGYKGKVYPINPKHPEIMGVKAYASVADVPSSIDMAIVVTPASTVLDLAKECAKKKVKTLVVISAGFGELGTKEGHDAESTLAEIAKESGMRLIGPNCLGIVRPPTKLNASFAKDMPPSGSIALISQSGAMAVALMDASLPLHIGYSTIASIGNKADMNECDFLEICEKDAKTKVIGLYLESIHDGRRFMETAKRIARTKPIVLIKSGVSHHGASAVSSHTGALAGSDSAIVALCRQTGIHRAHTTEEFLDLLRTLSTQPSLLSRNVAIITNAGGPGIMATDAAEKEGLTLAALDDKNAQALKKLLPPAASIHNPIDVLGDAMADRYKAAIDACGNDPNIDGVVCVLTPQIMTPCTDIAQAIIDMKKVHPLMPVTTSFMGEKSVHEARQLLNKSGVPCFATPEAAVHALGALLPVKLREYDTDESEPADDRESGAHELLKKHTGLIDEELTQQLFELYGLLLPKQSIAKTVDDAVEWAQEIGYPVIAKVSSPDILHKTDIGGVRANLKNDNDVRRAFKEIMDNCKKNAPTAGINGILIQQFLPIGNEFIVGALRDPVFGPLVMVGLGGIYTELFRDTTFRIAPISKEECLDMLTELKSWRLLEGMRGKAAADINALAETIYKVSVLMTDNENIKELDLNPVLVGEKSIIIADAKVIVMN